MKSFLFDDDIFLKTDHPLATGSMDSCDRRSGAVNDFSDASAFSVELRAAFPGRNSVIDLGTATGMVPLTMRRAGFQAVGLEGSEMPRAGLLGAWGTMSSIVRTCDIGKPFRIVDRHGHDVTFDFVTSWGVLEHIPKADIHDCLFNIARLMSADSLAILNIDLGFNPDDRFHMLWDNCPINARGTEACMDYLHSLLSSVFVIDEVLVRRDWNYVRSDPATVPHDPGPAVSGRSFWWLRKRATP